MQQSLSSSPSPLSSPAGAKGRPALRALRAAAAFLGLLATALGGFVACSGEECVGGVVVDGVCQGKCKPDLCKEQNTCVDNQCRLLCNAHLGCDALTQECVAATEDDTNAAISVCQPRSQGRGYGAGCPFGQAQCDDLQLVAGVQLLTCPDGSACGQDACGGHPEQCTDRGGTWACDDGTPCCAPDQCAPLACLSAGEGDAEAYCTKHGCKDDADCPSGYACGITRDPRDVCEGETGTANLCGETAEPCVQQGQLAELGLTEGSLCLLRNTCMKRAQCSPCETDLDCSRVEGQACVALAGGEKVCARTCTADPDCDPDFMCDGGSCKPRFGACKGQGNFCEPCQSDADCGGPGTTKACVSLSGNMRGCFDLSFPDSCVTDADCPAAPSGKRGECLDEAEGVPQGDPLYGRCYLPYNPADNKFSCW